MATLHAMSGPHGTLSARVSASFEGCYEARRAAALAGVPLSTVYLWARSGTVTPSVSPTRIKLWSYADLMTLRVVYWLRRPKTDRERDVPASPMARVREALNELERRNLDIWDDTCEHLDSPLRVDPSGEILIVNGGVSALGGQRSLPDTLDLLGPFDQGDLRGPDLRRPRPNLRIIPGRMSGEPHLAGSRITTTVAASLHRRFGDIDKVAVLYPDVNAKVLAEAVEFERSLAA